VSSFETVSHSCHDIHPHQTGISFGIYPKNNMISSSSCFSSLNTHVLCASNVIFVCCIALYCVCKRVICVGFWCMCVIFCSSMCVCLCVCLCVFIYALTLMCMWSIYVYMLYHICALICVCVFLVYMWLCENTCTHVPMYVRKGGQKHKKKVL
jgi:hypothetical protein